MIRQLLLSVIILMLLSIGAFSLWAANDGLEDPFQDIYIKAVALDTIPPLEERDGDFLTDPSSNPFDLNDPEAIDQTIEYDPATGQYILTERIGETLFRPPTYISFDEYMELTRQRDQQRFFDNLAGFNHGSGLSVDDPLAGVDVQSSLIDRLFGGTEISIQPQGSIDLTFGFDYQFVENPILPVRQKRQAGFDFKMAIQMNVTGQIGEKLKLSTNYSTQSTFNFDNQIKLDFNSDAFGEDDILKKIEAGDVSLPLRGQLIQGAQSLFGLKTELQFGHLRLTAIASQQQSENETITIQGGSQVTEFEVKSDDYDENRHFFLSHYNRDIYEEALTNLPQIKSLIQINPQDIEVWVTNDRNQVENTRDIVAFADLGEPVRFTNPDRVQSNLDNLASPNEYREICQGRPLPANEANTLFAQLNANRAWENIDKTVSVLTSSQFGLVQSRDFEKVRARKLTAREYTVHPQLGFISLNIPLQADQVLAVSYAYEYHGTDFTVGNLSGSSIETGTDSLQSTKVLVTKMLKSTTQRTDTPAWDLMMKNIYSIGAYQVNQEDFRLDVYYEDPGKGVKRFLPETNLAGIPLIRVFNLDKLNVQGDPQPDGIFDFVPGVTINPNNGRIIFPVLEPFGSFLGNKIDNTSERDKLAYNELYTKTKFIAQENPEKNRFVIKGSYKSSVTSEISLGAFNIPQGSVTVTGGGRTLDENVDYEIDYSTGRIRILNDALLSSGTPINVSFEDNSVFGLQNKTMLGLRADYELGENMNIGATFLNLFERPFTPKVNAGDDPINNKIYGLDFTMNKDLPWLTRAVDKLPFYSTTAPSSVSFLGETAMIDPGHSKAINQSKKDKAGIVYVDDFEGSASTIDVRQPTNQWYLASVPKNVNSNRFPESSASGITPGVNRARLNWYRIDAIARNNSDNNNIYTSRIPQQELFPNRSVQPTSQLAGGLQAFDLSFYPDERGPYNYDPPEGIPGISAGARPNTLDTITPVKLNDPETRWGGIMRSITTNDFQSANIEFLEFWMLSPFQDSTNATVAAQDVRKKEGTIYINLGNVSEDILQDSRRFFENGLPGPNTPNRRVDNTPWGNVPRGQQITNAFDLSAGARTAQDVGLDGMNDREEAIRFQTYLNQMQASQPLPALVNDPAGDNFTYYNDNSFSSSDGVLTRYKRFNNVQGNSGADQGNTGGLRSAGTNYPDAEDLDQDNTLNEAETYFEYDIPLRFDPLDPRKIDRAETPFITDEREDLTTGRVWYRFRIPLKGDFHRQAVGGIEDFRSIRFMRVYLQDFEAPVTLRFATMDLVRNQWRGYSLPLQQEGLNATECAGGEDNLQIDAVSIEENSTKTPFNYTLPEGIQREQSLGVFNQLQNEQSLALRIDNLCDGNAKAVFKYTEMDMRLYERLQMFTHAERRNPEAEAVQLEDDDLSLFIRLGSDFKNNYYEYEIPLKISREEVVAGLNANSSAYKSEVWRQANQLNFPLEILKNLKVKRNDTGASFSEEFSEGYLSDDGGQHRISVKGNPNLGFVKVMMIGVRNPTDPGDNPARPTYSIELWANELRLTGLDEDIGVAALGRMDVQLADLASVTVAGNYNSIGYGALDASVLERSREQVTGYDLSANIELGKFLPDNWGVRLPLYAQKSNTTVTPEYDPYDLDIRLKDKLANTEDKIERDSIKAQAQEIVNITTYNLTNVGKERSGGSDSGSPKPWDIENFSGNYSYTKTETSNPLIELDSRKEYTGGIDYSFSRSTKYLEPFKGIKNKNLKLIKEINLNPLPNSFTVSTIMDREFARTTYRFSDFADQYNTYFNKRFLWSRNYDLNWDITRSLKFSFNAIADAVIDEPDETVLIENQVQNIKQVRKDSIWKNIQNLGRPKLYTHNINVSYTLPIRYLPFMDWVQVRGQYQAGYTWNAASLSVDSLGNTIMNSQNRQLSADLNFEKLYNKVPILKKINRPARRPSSNRSNNNRASDKRGRKDKGDDEEKARAPSRNSTNSVSPIARAVLRPLMLVRKAKVSYNERFQTVVPGFTPDTKLLGLSSGFDAPGWDFVAGIQPKIRELNENWGGSNDWLNNAAQNGWITKNPFLNARVTQNYTQSLEGNLTLEPVKDFRIDIDVRRSFREDYTERFQVFDKPEPGSPDPIDALFEHSVPNYGGELTVSYNALKTFFRSSKDELVVLFDQFENYRPIISQRLGTGLHEDNVLAQLGYTDGYGRDQNEVLLPAFVAAYTGQDPSTIDLDLFKTPFKPNWRLSYNGLAKMKPFSDIFSSFNISHSFKSTFRVNNYYTNKQNRAARYNPDRSPRDSVSFNFFPRFEIPNVVIEEGFAPLLAVDMQFFNGMSMNFDYKQSRSLDFSTVNNQLTLTNSKEISAGFGYVLHGVNIGFLTGKKNGRKQRGREEEEEEAASPGGRGRQGRSGGRLGMNDLDLQFDFSLKEDISGIMELDDDGDFEPTRGAVALSISPSAEYQLNKNLSLRLFFDYRTTTPKTSTGFPRTDAAGGVVVRFQLN